MNKRCNYVIKIYSKAMLIEEAEVDKFHAIKYYIRYALTNGYEIEIKSN